MALRVPVRGNETLERVVARIDASEELAALWEASNITAIDRMRINDHGPVHIRIMTNIALKLLRLLMRAEVSPSVVVDHGLRPEDAEVIVVLAAALHDVGHVVHRREHESMSLLLAAPLVDRFLQYIYDFRTRTLVNG